MQLKTLIFKVLGEIWSLFIDPLNCHQMPEPIGEEFVPEFYCKTPRVSQPISAVINEHDEHSNEAFPALHLLHSICYSYVYISQAETMWKSTL